MTEHQKSINIIEQDMARSRAEIDRTTQALKSKMEPENLADAARQVIIESTQRVEEKVKGLAEAAAPRVENFGEQAIDYIHRNPMPALLAGLGVGLLITMAEREAEAPHVVEPRGTQPSRMDQTLAKHPSLMRAQRKTVRSARQVNRQHPLLLGAAVFGAGLLLGSLLPNTSREHQLLGPTRDRLLEGGKETAQEAFQQVKEAVDHELDKRKADAAELAQTAEEAALSAYHEARNEGDTERREAGQNNKVLP